MSVRNWEEVKKVKLYNMWNGSEETEKNNGKGRRGKYEIENNGKMV